MPFGRIRAARQDKLLVAKTVGPCHSQPGQVPHDRSPRQQAGVDQPAILPPDLQPDGTDPDRGEPLRSPPESVQGDGGVAKPASGKEKLPYRVDAEPGNQPETREIGASGRAYDPGTGSGIRSDPRRKVARRSREAVGRRVAHRSTNS